MIGFRISEHLHRFDVSVQLPAAGKGLAATNTVGEVTGQFIHR